MTKCDEYEMKLDMYKEGSNLLQNRIEKKKGKLVQARKDKGMVQDKVKGLEATIEDLNRKIRQLNEEAKKKNESWKIVSNKKSVIDSVGNKLDD